jgi:hypothetical protein
LSSSAAQYAAGAKDDNPDRERCASRKPDDLRRDGLCTLGPAGRPRFLVWGDSHADAMMPAFQKLATEHGIPGVILTWGGCPSVLGVARADRAPREFPCTALADFALDYVVREKIEHVVLASSWRQYYAGGVQLSDSETTDAMSMNEWHAAFARGMRRTLSALTAVGAHVWIVDQVPGAPENIPAKLAAVAASGGDPEAIAVPLRIATAGQGEMDELLKSISPNHPLLRVNPATKFCNATSCIVASGGRSLFRDGGHISTSGALFMADALEPIFQTLRN